MIGQKHLARFCDAWEVGVVPRQSLFADRKSCKEDSMSRAVPFVISPFFDRLISCAHKPSARARKPETCARKTPARARILQSRAHKPPSAPVICPR